MISKWSRVELQENGKEFANLLISSFKLKFQYELNSGIYQVASLLNISKLKLWYFRPDCQFIVKGTVEKLYKVLKFFTPRNIYQSALESQPGCELTQAKERLSSNDQQTDSLSGFMLDDNYCPEAREPNLQLYLLEIEKEKLYFFKQIEEKGLAVSVYPSYDFWFKNSKMPMLRKLFVILLNIPSSAAFIERYFSISGFVCEKRRGNMTADLIISRSLLKVNIKLLESLNDFSDDDDSDSET